MSLASIQQRLDALEPGGTLALECGDYAPCVITKPVILLCDGATFWTNDNFPAMTIHAENVVIKDVNLRAVVSSEHVVISVDKGFHPLLENISILGRAVGVEWEPSEWILPPVIRIGEISPQHPGFYLDFGVPLKSQIVCRISGVSFAPAALHPGINTVKLLIEDVSIDSILLGEIEIIGGALTRLIPFFARIKASASPTSPGGASPLIEITAQEKERFQKGLVANAPIGAQSSFTQRSPITSPSAHQNSQSIALVQRSQSQSAADSSAAEKSKVRLVKRQSTLKVLEDPLKFGVAFANRPDDVRTCSRIPIYILVDSSGAMAGDPIELLSTAISAIHSQLMNEPSAVERAFLSVIAFGNHAKQVVPLTQLVSFIPPKLVASGMRAMGEALKLLCQQIDYKSHTYQGYKEDSKPTIFLITGGAPTDDWQQYADKLLSKNTRNIIALSCSSSQDTSHLKYITNTVIEMEKMSPSAYPSFFRWSSTGLSPKTASISNDTASGKTSTNSEVIGNISRLFGGNTLSQKPLHPNNGIEPHNFESSETHDKSEKTAQLSKLFTEPRN